MERLLSEGRGKPNRQAPTVPNSAPEGDLEELAEFLENGDGHQPYTPAQFRPMNLKDLFQDPLNDRDGAWLDSLEEWQDEYDDDE